ncbi:regulating synaptic membrane exocytosis protein 2 [Lasius niger]|uniref:Regulating synaptic membrane exocytosis protein 2 n=1 Tax=Lasius niger TaxID=67767 RepID=A0A0J7LAI5_LASNI|nr:regulating synaptic membrane exocytosis protein 2 [Lasius niger]
MIVGHGYAATVRVSSRSSVAYERQSAKGIDINLLLVSRLLVEAEERQKIIRHSQRTNVATKTAEVEHRTLQGGSRDSRPHLLTDR